MTNRTIAICGLLLVCLAVGVSLFSVGYVALEKAAVLLVMPVSFVWLLSIVIVAAAIIRRQRLLAGLAMALCLVSYTVASPLLSSWLIRTLEAPYVEVDPFNESPFAMVVVLGGGSNVAANGVPQLTSAGDRLMLAARMYEQGLALSIVCAGEGIEALVGAQMDPAASARSILEGLGVPASAIQTVGGINTSMEIRNLAGIMVEGERVGLITSAWHLPRAMRLARRQGLDVIPLPSNFTTTLVRRPTWIRLIPDAESARNTTLAIREYLAMLAGR